MKLRLDKLSHLVVLLSFFIQPGHCDTCTATGVSCSTCQEIRVCLQASGEPTFVSCSGTTPYCNVNRCDTVSSMDCPSSFGCPSDVDGFFPDGSDCTKYYACVDSTSYNMSCEVANTNFSPDTHSCVKRTSEHPCVTVSCSGLNMQWVAYELDKSIYFLCIDGSPTLAKMCPVDYEEYSSTSNACEIVCKDEGLLADPDAEGYYYECVVDNSGTKFNLTRKACPTKTGYTSYFNSTIPACQFKDDSTVTDATVTTTTTG